MQFFLKVCFSLMVVFSWLTPAEATSALSSSLPFASALKEGKKAVNIELKKPEHMAALDWLSHLEERRDDVELKQDYATFRKVTQEISATLAGKYGISTRPATVEERQQMIASITRTRQHFSGIPDILSQLYFNHDPVGCREKVKKDPTYAQHMGVILAVDTICYVTRQQTGFAESFVIERQAPVTSTTFINIVADMMAGFQADRGQETFRKTMTTFLSNVWEALVRETSQQLDIMAPNISVRQIFDELMVSGDDGYQGWELHGMNALGSWVNEGGELIAQTKKSVLIDQEDAFMLRPLWYQGLLLDPSFKEHFKGLDDHYFKEGYLGISYCFFLPLHDERSFHCPPLRFYLTKALPKERDKKNFTQQRCKANDLAQQETLWVETTKQLEKAFAFKGRWISSDSPTNLSKSLSLFKEVADQGHKMAQDIYALMLQEEKGGDASLQKMRQYFKMAADQGLRESQFNYALMLKSGKGGPPDPIQARAYFKMAADQRHALAQNNYALMLREGKEGDADVQEARRYFKMAVDQGLKESLFNYALMLLEGGGAADLQEAQQYFKMAADQGHADAQDSYALMLQERGAVDLQEAQ